MARLTWLTILLLFVNLIAYVAAQREDGTTLLDLKRPIDISQEWTVISGGNKHSTNTASHNRDAGLTNRERAGNLSELSERERMMERNGGNENDFERERRRKLEVERGRDERETDYERERRRRMEIAMDSDRDARDVGFDTRGKGIASLEIERQRERDREREIEREIEKAEQRRKDIIEEHETNDNHGTSNRDKRKGGKNSHTSSQRERDRAIRGGDKLGENDRDNWDRLDRNGEREDRLDRDRQRDRLNRNGDDWKEIRIVNEENWKDEDERRLSRLHEREPQQASRRKDPILIIEKVYVTAKPTHTGNRHDDLHTGTQHDDLDFQGRPIWHGSSGGPKHEILPQYPDDRPIVDSRRPDRPFIFPPSTTTLDRRPDRPSLYPSKYDDGTVLRDPKFHHGIGPHLPPNAHGDSHGFPIAGVVPSPPHLGPPHPGPPQHGPPHISPPHPGPPHPGPPHPPPHPPPPPTGGVDAANAHAALSHALHAQAVQAGRIKQAVAAHIAGQALAQRLVAQQVAAGAAATRLKAARLQQAAAVGQAKAALKTKLKKKLKDRLHTLIQKEATNSKIVGPPVEGIPVHPTIAKAPIHNHKDDLFYRLVLLKPYFEQSGAGYAIPKSLPDLPHGARLTPVQVAALPKIPIQVSQVVVTPPPFSLPAKLREVVDPPLDPDYIEYLLGLPPPIFRTVTSTSKREFLVTLFPRLYRNNVRHLSPHTTTGVLAHIGTPTYQSTPTYSQSTPTYPQSTPKYPQTTPTYAQSTPIYAPPTKTTHFPAKIVSSYVTHAPPTTTKYFPAKIVSSYAMLGPYDSKSHYDVPKAPPPLYDLPKPSTPAYSYGPPPKPVTPAPPILTTIHSVTPAPPIVTSTPYAPTTPYPSTPYPPTPYPPIVTTIYPPVTTPSSYGPPKADDCYEEKHHDHDKHDHKHHDHDHKHHDHDHTKHHDNIPFPVYTGDHKHTTSHHHDPSKHPHDHPTHHHGPNKHPHDPSKHHTHHHDPNKHPHDPSKHPHVTHSQNPSKHHTHHPYDDPSKHHHPSDHHGTVTIHHPDQKHHYDPKAPHNKGGIQPQDGYLPPQKPGYDYKPDDDYPHKVHVHHHLHQHDLIPHHPLSPHGIVRPHGRPVSPDHLGSNEEVKKTHFQTFDVSSDGRVTPRPDKDSQTPHTFTHLPEGVPIVVTTSTASPPIIGVGLRPHGSPHQFFSPVTTPFPPPHALPHPHNSKEHISDSKIPHHIPLHSLPAHPSSQEHPSHHPPTHPHHNPHYSHKSKPHPTHSPLIPPLHNTTPLTVKISDSQEYIPSHYPPNHPHYNPHYSHKSKPTHSPLIPPLHNTTPITVKISDSQEYIPSHYPPNHPHYKPHYSHKSKPPPLHNTTPISVIISDSQEHIPSNYSPNHPHYNPHSHKSKPHSPIHNTTPLPVLTSTYSSYDHDHYDHKIPTSTSTSYDYKGRNSNHPVLTTTHLPGVFVTTTLKPPIDYHYKIPTTTYHPKIPTTTYHPKIPTKTYIPTTNYYPKIPTTTYHPKIPTNTYHPKIPTTTYHPKIPTSTYLPPIPTNTYIPTTTYYPKIPTSTYLPPIPTTNYYPKIPTTTFRPPIPTTTYEPLFPTTTFIPPRERPSSLRPPFPTTPFPFPNNNTISNTPLVPATSPIFVVTEIPATSTSSTVFRLRPPGTTLSEQFQPGVGFGRGKNTKRPFVVSLDGDDSREVQEDAVVFVEGTGSRDVLERVTSADLIPGRDLERIPGTDANDDDHILSPFTKRKGNATNNGNPKTLGGFRPSLPLPQFALQQNPSNPQITLSQNPSIPQILPQNPSSHPNTTNPSESERKPPVPQRVGTNGLPVSISQQSFPRGHHHRLPDSAGVPPSSPLPGLTAEDLARLPGYLREPPHCATFPTNRSFCLMPHGYPSELAASLVEQYKDKLQEAWSVLSQLPKPALQPDAQTALPDIDFSVDCESEDRNVSLSWSRDVLGSWFVILQTPPFPQQVTVTTCSSASRRKGCRPLLQPRPLLALQPRDPEPRPFVFDFPLPVACVYPASNPHPQPDFVTSPVQHNLPPPMAHRMSDALMTSPKPESEPRLHTMTSPADNEPINTVTPRAPQPIPSFPLTSQSFPRAFEQSFPPRPNALPNTRDDDGVFATRAVRESVEAVLQRSGCSTINPLLTLTYTIILLNWITFLTT